LFVPCLAAFMATLDGFIVNVAFDAIRTSYQGTPLADVSWVPNAYTVVFAALLVPAGRLADRYGRRAGFIAGLTFFSAFSVGCAYSPTIWWLVAFRAAQAVGAALMVPSSLGLVIAAAPPERRASWVWTWATAGTLAAALGPAIGGALVQVSWRWVFLINVPIGLAAVVAAASFVPPSRDPSATRAPDLRGALLLITAIGAMMLGIVQAPTWGWSSAGVIGSWIATVVLAAGFVVSSRSHPIPLVDASLLRIGAFAWANGTALLFSVSFSAAVLTTVLWLQDGWGYSPLRAGLAIAPGPLVVPLLAAAAHRARSRIRVGVIVSVGCLTVAAGDCSIGLSLRPGGSYLHEMLPGWLAAGVGTGLALPTLISSATADLPVARAATGSGILTMVRQVGLALGVCVVVVGLGNAHSPHLPMVSIRHLYLVTAALGIGAALAALGMTPRHGSTAAQEPVAVESECTHR
jgi:EmrB/QacA subfamily drug resistance transporter